MSLPGGKPVRYWKGGDLTALRDEVATVSARVAAAQADSVAADVATLKADFNALLAKLRAAGLLTT